MDIKFQNWQTGGWISRGFCTFPEDNPNPSEFSREINNHLGMKIVSNLIDIILGYLNLPSPLFGKLFFPNILS